MGPRTTQQRSAVDDWDIDAEESSEERCVNISPYVARLEFATVPGSKPRRHVVPPCGGLYVQRGYARPYTGSAGKEMPPTIFSLSEIEAWPGRREPDKDGKLVWVVQPGPRLPMVVPESEAKVWQKRWDTALAAKAEADKAPLRLTLQRTDGTEVQVQAEIAKPAPAAARRAVEDDEDQMAGGDEPPPEHDDPIPGDDAAPVQLPPAAAPAVPPPAIPTRAEAKGRRGGS